jgi:enterochelin esterase-like enzyme
VFAADGGWHVDRLVAALEAGGHRSTMVVAIHGMDDDEGRLHEYVPGFDEERFAAHERFFADEVVGWVRTGLGIDLPAERTAVWGASLGGELALAMGLRHPDVFGVVLSLSPGAGFRPAAELPRPLPRVYLAAGTKEPFFLENATRWGDALRAAGADVVLEERDGDHGDPFWFDELPRMVAWAFGGSAA